MILSIIIWIIKNRVAAVHKIKLKYEHMIYRVIGTAILVLFCFTSSKSQTHLSYVVMRNGEKVGNMKMMRLQNNNEVEILIESDINIRMIKNMHVVAKEKSIYKNNRLVYSTVYRELNGKQKASRQTQYKNNAYELITESKKQTINNVDISFNLAMLYFLEPVNVKNIYSDYYQQLIEIKNLSNNAYKLQLPNGDYNIYYYNNKVCSKVEVHSTFYTVQINLV